MESEFTLNSPLTEEDLDKIYDVDMDSTSVVTFHTKHGKDVEFVKVVRCKNCKYWDESDIHSTVNPNCRCRAVVRKNYTDSEFYCAYGERKDGKQSGTD